MPLGSRHALGRPDRTRTPTARPVATRAPRLSTRALSATAGAWLLARSTPADRSVSCPARRASTRATDRGVSRRASMLRPGVPYMEEQMCTRACTAESSGPSGIASGEWWLVVDLKQPGRGSTRPPRVASEACRVSAADAVKHGKPSRSSSPSCRVGCYGPRCGSRCGSRHSRDSHLSLPRRRSPASDTRRARAADRVSGRIERGTSESPRNPVRFNHHHRPPRG